MIKTFRGLMADGVQDTIVLHTNDGAVGYRIKKFEIMTQRPGTTAYEHVVQIWKTKQVAVDNVVDFSNQTLLAAAFIQDDSAPHYVASSQVVFDTEIFNQDIYVTHSETNAALACNYYIELEQFSLDLSENTVATLKDIRNTKTQGF